MPSYFHFALPSYFFILLSIALACGPISYQHIDKESGLPPHYLGHIRTILQPPGVYRTAFLIDFFLIFLLLFVLYYCLISFSDFYFHVYFIVSTRYLKNNTFLYSKISKFVFLLKICLNLIVYEIDIFDHLCIMDTIDEAKNNRCPIMFCCFWRALVWQR